MDGCTLWLIDVEEVRDALEIERFEFSGGLTRLLTRRGSCCLQLLIRVISEARFGLYVVSASLSDRMCRFGLIDRILYTCLRGETVAGSASRSVPVSGGARRFLARFIFVVIFFRRVRSALRLHDLQWNR